MPPASPLRFAIPSVDRILRHERVAALVATHGHEAVVAAARQEADRMRTELTAGGEAAAADTALDRIARRVEQRVALATAATLRPLINLTGTVLHTNLGRALLPGDAVQAAIDAATAAVNLEFDLETGKRGDRDLHLERRLRELTGAQKATAVNNNAAAVLLALNTLALGREVVVSRGELIEIGGEFRMPEIMRRAGCRLVEVGTTNRTHLRDYAEAIGPKTALVMKVHPSNYKIVGFTKSVEERSLAQLARERGIPLISDLGAGALLDLRRWGLPYENTAADMLAAGVDLVTFSADKLLGGPQAGIIVGRSDLVGRINRNALKRAVRLDKMRIAALAAVLRLYSDPDRLPARLPTLRHLCRTIPEMHEQAERLHPVFERALAGRARVVIEPTESQPGSGSLPQERLPSVALVVRDPSGGKRGSRAIERMADAFRRLPVPVVGRVHDGALFFDLRCLDDEGSLVDQLGSLDFAAPKDRG